MTKFQRGALVLLRVSMGWMFLYAGVVKLINPGWSAERFLNNAKSFPEFFAWFASPSMLPLTDFLNEWGLTLLGISLILGIGVRLATILGVALMALYYLPLDFPKPNANSFVVDDHIIYIFALLVLGAFKAGRYFGLENWCSNLPICRKYPALRSLLG